MVVCSSCSVFIMVSMFVCSKCKKMHTIEEFIESRFCRVCGKLLTSKNKVNIPAIYVKQEAETQKIENKDEVKGQGEVEEEHDLFPYKPYPEQSILMREIKEIVGEANVLVTEACNGFGKTACALASILSLNRKIVYATRTHEQVHQVLLEVESINRKSGNRFSAVNFAGRQHLCLNEDCRGLSAREAMETCRLLQETKRCPYRADFTISNSSMNLVQVWSINNLKKLGKANRVCPYFLARKFAETCDVIVAPYQYVFNENIRRIVRLDLSGRVLVFDEAHNADQIGQDVLSDILSERTLNGAKQELDQLKADSGFIEALALQLKKEGEDRNYVESGVTFHYALKQDLQTEKLSEFTAELSGLVEDIRLIKIEKGENPACYLNGIVSFLEHVENSSQEKYAAIYRKSFQGLNLVEYRCLDPSLALRPVLEAAYGALIMSGTLSPLELFTEILGLKQVETRSYHAIADPKNICTIIDSSVTTKFTERNLGMIQRYGEHITKQVNRIQNGVLVFFPQRKFLLDNLNLWLDLKIIEKHEKENQLFIGGKPLFVEGAYAEENRNIVEAYKAQAKNHEGAVLFGVFRGRNAEGSNFPYEEAGGVILVGVPYADYSDPIIKTQINYFNNVKKDMGERWYLMDAFRAANQALGRGIRHRDDWCTFILMDNRYKTYKNLISKWITQNGVREIVN